MVGDAAQLTSVDAGGRAHGGLHVRSVVTSIEAEPARIQQPFANYIYAAECPRTGPYVSETRWADFQA